MVVYLLSDNSIILRKCTPGWQSCRYGFYFTPELPTWDPTPPWKQADISIIISSFGCVNLLLQYLESLQLQLTTRYVNQVGWILRTNCDATSVRNIFFAYSASVHTYPAYPAYKSTSLLMRSSEWKFLNTLCQSRIIWTPNPDIFFYPVTLHYRTQFFAMNIQDGAERNVFASLLLWL